jgi:hypothetical protein
MPQRSREDLDEHAFASALEGRHDVARRHVVAAWANAASLGQSPRELTAAVDRLFPELRESRGVRETTVPVSRARMVAVVREHGPRPLHERELAEWAQRSRDRAGTWSERSR